MKNIPEFSLKKHPLIIFNHFFLSKYIDDISFLNVSLLQSKNFDFDTAILGPERAVADIINPAFHGSRFELLRCGQALF